MKVQKMNVLLIFNSAKMNFSKVTIVIISVFVLQSQLAFSQKQQQILINDFENKPNTSGWWKDNPNVKFSYDENAVNQVDKQSKVCLYVRWDSVPKNRPWAWFTDLKADTFATEGMEEKWKSFQENTWLSFWCKGGQGDTLMLHYLVLSKGHKSKWGAKKMIPVTSNKWTFFKVRFADLQYEDWGKVIAPFNLKTNEVKCFEVGLRLSATSPKGFVEAWFDNVKLTNYEPLK